MSTIESKSSFGTAFGWTGILPALLLVLGLIWGPGLAFAATADDTDGDGLTDVEERDTYNTDPNDADTDDDGLSDGAEVNNPYYPSDPNDPDTDGDNLQDGEELNTYQTNPRLADTDGDGVNDDVDALPRDRNEWEDFDGDGVGRNSDVNDSDPNIAWTSTFVTVTQDATVAANLIATFDDTTEGPAAIRADSTKYKVTGVFADGTVNAWNHFENRLGAARVGDASVTTSKFNRRNNPSAIGSITIKNVPVTGNYISFLMTGGDGRVSVGIEITQSGAEGGGFVTPVASWKPNACGDRYIKSDQHWRYFDMGELVGESVDIKIYDNDNYDRCGFIAFDHFYQSDTPRGELADTASPDPDRDGLPNDEEARYNTDPNLADTDGDGLSDYEEVNHPRYPTDPLDPDTDDDGLTDGYEINICLTHPNQPDTDNDGLNDEAEIRLKTDPNRWDTDGDYVSDLHDAFPTDRGEWRDADEDGLGHNTDVNDNDPENTWTRANVAVGWGGEFSINQIATFDAMTQDPAAIRADTTKYEVTGVFADATVTNWNEFDSEEDAARVGPASVSTWQIGGTTGAEATGTIKIKNVTVTSRHLVFLMAGGGSGADVGIKVKAAGTESVLASWQPETCDNKYLKANLRWTIIKVKKLIGQSIDIEIYDNDSTNACGFIAFDHFYQSDTRARRSTRVDIAVPFRDYDGDGVGYDLDANDNDASVTWTRTIVTLTPDATVAANLIATFDDTTDDIAAMRANTTKYTLTGMFADPNVTNWNTSDGRDGVARVGAASVATRGVGTIKINGVVIKGDYINFLMTGGGRRADVGVRLLEAGTTTVLAKWAPTNFCSHYLTADWNWKHFDVSALKGQSVDIEIYDNNDVPPCHTLAFDHFYQSDISRGKAVGSASLDTDGDNLSDNDEAHYGTDPNLTDTDGDGLDDYAELRIHGTRPTRADSDGDGLTDGEEVNIYHTYPNSRDSDNDGLSDGDEVNTHNTNPLRRDTDYDGVNDGIDAFPNDRYESVDADNDGVGAGKDANDNDASVTWTRTRVTLTPDATVAANLIATFDDTTDDVAAMRANPDKYTLTGVFANPEFDEQTFRPDQRWRFLAYVGTAAVSTTFTSALGTGSGATGSIKIKGVTIRGDYLNILMVGGGGSADVGIRLYAAGSSTLLMDRQPNECQSYIVRNDDDWWHFDVSTLGGRSVDIEIYDSDSTNLCGFLVFDHLYQSDSPRGTALIAVASDSDGDGVPDSDDAFPNDSSETADNDGDGTGDNADLDDDNDGLPDSDEVRRGTNPLIADTDGDGLSDGAEVNTHNSNPLLVDTDSDDLSDGDEVNRHGTNPALADTDGDGLNDGVEVNTYLDVPPLFLPALESDDYYYTYLFDEATGVVVVHYWDIDEDGDTVIYTRIAEAHELYYYRRSDPLLADTDGDGLNDGLELNTFGTRPWSSDTDYDGVDDGSDPFPLDGTRTFDADNDSVDFLKDANDDDASITWTRTRVSLTPDATVAANLIATFDDVTEGPAAIRADTDKYEVTGVFADNSIDDWNVHETGRNRANYARVGPASASTWFWNDVGRVAENGGLATGSIRIKNVALTGDYISFLATSGTGVEAGIKLYLAGTELLLASWKRDDYACGSNLRGDYNWKHFDVSSLTDQSVDILIYDNDTSRSCGSISFDHFYQSDSARGVLVGTAAIPTISATLDTDEDGLTDLDEVLTHNTDPRDADSDDDGLNDGAEIGTHGTNPNKADSDGDFLNDGAEVNIHKSNPWLVDTDGDLLGDGLEVDSGTNPLLADTDGDGLIDSEEMGALRTNPRIADTDGDGLTDGEEVNTHETNPRLADTDGDGVNDGIDAFPNDRNESMDADNDGVGHNIDANDNDASVTWTRTGVTLTQDATVAANIIATFDDTTDDLAAMRTKPDKYTLTGVFTNPELDEWILGRSRASTPHVGTTAVYTTSMPFGYKWWAGNGPTGSIKIKGVTIRGDYLNLLMSGGGGSIDVGIRLFTAGTSTVLTNRQPKNCAATVLSEDENYPWLRGDVDWKHFDVSGLAGQSVDIEIYDNDNSSRCGHLVFDHLYQSDSPRGTALVASSDSDSDGVPDSLDAFPNDRTETADNDGDGTGDNADLDDDNDGLPDSDEVRRGTNPLVADTDGDGLSDGTEVNTHGSNPLLADTDGDGLRDGSEINAHRTNPSLADTDSDGLNDGDEVRIHGTSPTRSDTDGDGLTDSEEVNTHGTNPRLADTDGDNLNDGAELGSDPATSPLLADTDGDSHNDDRDAFPTNPYEWRDEDGDGVGHNADFDDNDASITVASQVVDTDGDGVPDGDDAFPNDRYEWRDSDEDGVGHNSDANDNDASVTWTRYRVTLTPDATVAANLIATFDDTTDDIAAIQANPTKYTLTGMFASPEFSNNWNVEYGNYARVGDASISTVVYSTGRASLSYVGSIKINGVTIKGDYLNFLMAGGGGSADVGIRVFAAGTSTMLVNRQPNGCYLDNLNGFVIPYISDDDDWWHIDVSTLKGQSVDIEIYDDDDTENHCGFMAFDHLYQSDNPRGSAAIALALAPSPDTDTDGDGLTDVAEMDIHNTDPRDADSDDDGLNDGAEISTHGTNPNRADSDGDGLSDGAEVNTHSTNPVLADTDSDGLGDGDEINIYRTNPFLVDTDEDGLTDNEEVRRGTNPLVADTDGDNLNDGAEISTHGTNPLLADTDGDGWNDNVDAFPTNPSEWRDEDGDGVGHNTDADDNDPSVTVAPQVVDTDGDGWNDDVDAFPRDRTEWRDADRDGVGHNTDANDNDASVTWTRYRVTLTPDATVAANLIATFDDTTDDIAAIQANTTKYTLTGMFASPAFANNWNVEYGDHAALVGDASVSTVVYVESFSATRYSGGIYSGSIKVNGVTIKGDYLNFLMAGGGGSTKVGLRIFAAGTSTMLVNRQPNGCYLGSLNGFIITYISDDDDWWHIDVSALKGQSVDIEIYDDDDTRSDCGFVAFDHLYQSDSPRGTAMIALALGPSPDTDTDGDGLTDVAETGIHNTDPRDADTDDDGLSDGYEVNTLGTDPTNSDTDDDNVSDYTEINYYDTDPNDADTDNDGLTDDESLKHRTHPLVADSDHDGLSDGGEILHGTNPLLADTDFDGLFDNVDPSPTTRASSVDVDRDSVDARYDANDNDASVTWTRTKVSLTADATAAANLIATFDDTTEDAAAMRADTTKYTLTGVFANTSVTSWNPSDEYSARVGDAAVITDVTTTGAIKVNGVTIRGDYLNFLMAGGDGTVEAGIRLYVAGTAELLADWKPNTCNAIRNDRYLSDDTHWWHINVAALAGRSVDIEFYDNDSASYCGFLTFDHLYQSDSARGGLTVTAVSPSDSDGDGVPDSLDAFPNNSTEWGDNDGDNIGDNADTDDDNDNVSDSDELRLNTNPLVADTDGDGVNDGLDAFPLDRTEWTDADNDGLGSNTDADDNDPSVRWTRTSLTLPPDATAPANLIATFDGTTDTPAEIRAQTTRYAVTGIFQNPGLINWNNFDSISGAARVGDASVSTWQIGGTTDAGATGTIKIRNVTLSRNNINFLMAGGNGSVDVGVKILAAGTSVTLASWMPNTCGDAYLKGDQHWQHFDVSDLVGEVVDIEIADNATGECGHIAFDHFYQSDTGVGTEVGVAAIPEVGSSRVTIDSDNYLRALVPHAGFEDPLAMQSTGGWQFTGFFDNPASRDAWVGVSDDVLAGRVGDRAVSTCASESNCIEHRGILTSPAFKVTRDYIQFLMAGGNGSANVGVRLVDTFGKVLQTYNPGSCSPRFINGDEDWVWFDVSDIMDAYVRLVFFDEDSTSPCGFVSFDHAYQTNVIHQPSLGKLVRNTTGIEVESLGYNILQLDENAKEINRVIGRFDSPLVTLGAEGWQATRDFQSPGSTDAWKGTSGAGRIGERAVSTCKLNGQSDCVEATGTLTSEAIQIDADYPYLSLYVAGGDGAVDVGVRVLDSSGDMIPGLEYIPGTCGVRGDLNEAHRVSFDLSGPGWAGQVVRLQIFDNSTVACGYLTFDHVYTTDMAAAIHLEEMTGDDRDSDGYPDDVDAFPDDSTEWKDSDGDGVGNNADAFPNDPKEVADRDGDGVGDNRDVDDANVSVAHEPDAGQILLDEGKNARKVVADFDDPVAMQKNPARYRLTGVFADETLAREMGWNRFETEDEEAGLPRSADQSAQ